MPLAVFPKCYLDALCVTGEMTVEDWVDLSQQVDCDGLEMFAPSLPAEDPEHLERIRRRVEDQGRCIAMICASPDFTRPDPADREQEIRKHRENIATAAALGAGYCRVLSGQRRPGVERREGIEMVRVCIEQLLPFAEKNRVVLILENHYKDNYWQYPEFAQKMEVFLELLDVIPTSEWFGVNYDPSNTIIAGEDPIALLEAVKDRVVTMHASDRYFEGGTIEDLNRIDADPNQGYATILTHGVIGQGLNDYDRIFSILRDAGFQGWVSIEDGPDPETGVQDLIDSAKFLRAKMAEHGLM